MNRIRIESDGTPVGTRITFGGELVRGVQSVSWHADAHSRPVACLHIVGAQLEVDVPAGDVVVIGRRESEADEGMELEEPGRLMRFLLRLGAR